MFIWRSKFETCPSTIESVLDPYAYLYEEPRLLLQQELREPRVYFSLLRAIAGGQTRLNEIAQECQLPSNTVGRYLALLSRLHLVERRTPVNEGEGSRRGLYRISDPFLRFWFRFVFPNRSELEVGESEEGVQPDLSSSGLRRAELPSPSLSP